MSLVSSIVESHQSCPCLCTSETMSSSKSSSISRGRLSLYRNLVSKKHLRSPCSLVLSNSFVNAWYEWRLSAKFLSGIVCSYSKRRRKMVVVSELGGQYEEGFNDVTVQILNYFTIKAVRTVLHQLYEMNPTQYRWFYDFLVANHPGDGKRFIRNLQKEKHELAERIMVTRLHLYGKWIKKCDHSKIYQRISDENLELMRERLMETVIWPSDDSSTSKTN